MHSIIASIFASTVFLLLIYYRQTRWMSGLQAESRYLSSFDDIRVLFTKEMSHG
jgi:hypothetical protein